MTEEQISQHKEETARIVAKVCPVDPAELNQCDSCQ